MLTGRQIRAARALLDWDAIDLAERAGLTRETISNLETGAVKPRAGSLEQISKAFTEAGVEFNGDRGVTLRDDNYRVMQGSDCWLRTLDDVYYSLRGKSNAEALF